MYNYNFLNVNFAEKESFSIKNNLYFYFLENGEIFSDYKQRINMFSDFLTKEPNDIFTTYKDNSFINIALLDKTKNVEKNIVNIIKTLLSKNNTTSIQIYLGNLKFNEKLLVSKLLLETKNNWNLKTKELKIKEKNVTFICSNYDKDKVKNGIHLAHSQTFVQELVDSPSNILTPMKLAQKAKDKVLEDKLFNLEVNVYEKDYIAEQKMGSFLSVAKGSAEKPALLVMKYMNGSKEEKPTVLVGKGLTFDSGGISIKHSAGMDAMKTDMAGAATVIGAMLYAAKANLKVNLIGIAACCENMPDGKSLKPGDVITAMNGTTIEVLDTDAEGRLVLADALNYAKQFDPKYTIDFATLTGACVVALGHIHSGIFTQDEYLAKELIKSGETMQDLAWQLPMIEEHEAMLDSNIADISNLCLGKGAGAQNGAIFLKRFAPEKGWCHVDIAGTSNIKGVGATSRPLAMISEFLDNQ